MIENIPNEATRTITVIFPSTIATSSLYVGEKLFVFGSYDQGVLHAMGTRPMDGDSDDDSTRTFPLPPSPTN